MGAINFGPLALSAGPLMLLAVVLVASLARLWAARACRVDVQPLIGKVLLVGLLTARIAFIGMYPDAYRASPWSVFDIRDGGFFGPAGILSAMAMAAWLAWSRRKMRRPLLVAVGAGAFAWIAFAVTIMMPTFAATPVPDVPLTRLDGTAV